MTPPNNAPPPRVEDDLRHALRQLETTNQGLERLKVELEQSLERANARIAVLESCKRIAPGVMQLEVGVSQPHECVIANDEATVELAAKIAFELRCGEGQWATTTERNRSFERAYARAVLDALGKEGR